MPVNFRIDRNRGLVVGRATGEVMPDELIAAFDTIAKESKGQAVGMPMLFRADEQASHHAVNIEGLERVRENMRKWRDAIGITKPIRNAIVARDFVHDPVPPLWQALNDADTAMGIVVRVFPTEDAALAWLAEDK